MYNLVVRLTQYKGFMLNVLYEVVINFSKISANKITSDFKI